MIKRLILKTYEADYDQFDELEQGSLLRLDDLEIKSVSFYHIDHIKHVNHLCCIVVSGCREYVVAESEESVHAKIEQIMAFKWN